MKEAFEKAGVKGSNPRPQNSRQRSSGHSKDRGKDERNPEVEYDRNLKAFWGENYVTRILRYKDADYNKLVTDISEYAKNKLGNATTSQLRNIFSQILKKHSAFEIQMLRPKLYYVAGRREKKDWQTRQLVFLLDQLIQSLDDEHVERFKDFFEAIIAYHKYHHGASSN